MSSYRKDYTRRSSKDSLRSSRPRSRSPRRDTEQTDIYRDRDRDRDREIKESMVQTNNNNTPILESPFTFGMEWEPTGGGQYFPNDDYKHYDRETIFTSDKKNLKVTIEDFKIKDSLTDKDITVQQERDSCHYTIEFAIGILGKNPPTLIHTFLRNNQHFIPQIEEELNDFKENFFEKQKQNLRSLYIRERDKPVLPNIFTNCALTDPITEENKRMYPYAYKKTEYVDTMSGRPQVTLGLNYALFTPLLFFYKSTNAPDINLTFKVYNGIMQKSSVKQIDYLDINNRLVCEGFGLLIIYYSAVASLYIQKDIAATHSGVKGRKYFKAAFYLKPRSNLAESYKHLKAEYTDFKEFIDLFCKIVNDSLIEIGIDITQIDSYTSLVDLHLEIIKQIATDDNEDIIARLKRRIYPTNNTNKYQDISAFMRSINYNKYNQIMTFITLVNASYLMKKIFNPQKVVKLKIKGEKIKQGCKFLDGYYYSYEGESKDVIDDLVSKKYAKIINNTIYDFAHTSDPQILEVEKKGMSEIESICPSDREELFEYIPEDSNLIIEVRYPEHLIDKKSDEEKKDSSSIEFRNITDFIKEFFSTIDHIFRFFIRKYSLPLPYSILSQSTMSMLPQPMIPQTEEPARSCTSRVYSKTRDSTGCDIMFRPKAKSKTNKSKTRKSKRTSKNKRKSKNKRTSKSKK